MFFSQFAIFLPKTIVGFELPEKGYDCTFCWLFGVTLQNFTDVFESELIIDMLAG